MRVQLLFSMWLVSAFVPVMRLPALEAFPGAIGFGAGTSGARGQNAEVCVVTSLADAGAGSFRACAEQISPAYITFAVSGYVDLSDEVTITGNKTIECATAPGDGVVFRRAGLDVAGDNVIVRGCRVWSGSDPEGEPLEFRDGIIVDGHGAPVRNAIVANNSMLFATDENSGTWNPVEDVTFQQNIIAWAVDYLGGEDSLGMLISHGPDKVSVVENLLASNFHRNPAVRSLAPIEIVNNLIFCYGENGTVVKGGSTTAHVIGNRYKKVCLPINAPAIKLRDGSVAYTTDNTMSDGSPAVIDPDGTSEQAEGPLFASTITPRSSHDVETWVLSKVGPADRIAFENEAIQHYINGTGGFIESVDGLGGWPTLQGGTNPLDSDADGMPNWWEIAHCGTPCPPTGDHDQDGYENIEEWFHSFYDRRVPVRLEVADPLLGSGGNGVFEPGEKVTVLSTWRNDGSETVDLEGAASRYRGPAGATYELFAADASYGIVEPGGARSCEVTGVCYELGVSLSGARPAIHWDTSFVETLSETTEKTWGLHIGESFGDVGRSSSFYPFIEVALHAGVTNGCGAAAYCPESSLSRGQATVLLLRAAESGNYAPPMCEAGRQVFTDVRFDSQFCPWIEELADRGVAGGCASGRFCPNTPIKRQELAVLLLKSVEGVGYEPPSCTGIFADVACPSLFADWIEDLTTRGITDGCGSSPRRYCPAASVTRGQAAVFVTRSFGLSLYGP